VAGVKHFYFDIETVPLEQYRHVNTAGFHSECSKVITMQFQELDCETGEPKSELTIYKDWQPGYSEIALVRMFKHNCFNTWDFIPVGNNIRFDIDYMVAKIKQYYPELKEDTTTATLNQKPSLDLKNVLMLINNDPCLRYKSLLAKNGEASHMAEWYYNKQYDKIEEYIQDEAKNFVNMYKIAKKELPKIKALFCTGIASTAATT